MEKSDKPDNESSADEPEIDDESSEGSAEESLRERIKKGVKLTRKDRKRLWKNIKAHGEIIDLQRSMRSMSDEVFMDPLPEEAEVDKFSPKKDPQFRKMEKKAVEAQEEDVELMRSIYNKVRKKELEAEMEKVRKTKGSKKELEKLRNQYTGVLEELLKFEYRNHSPNEINEVLKREARRLEMQRMEEDREDQNSQEPDQASWNIAGYFPLLIGLFIFGIFFLFIKTLS